MNFSTGIGNQYHFQKQTSLVFAVLMLITILSAGAIQAQDNTLITAETFRVINVRSGPSVDNPVIAQLDSGSIVDVIGRSNTESDWLQIEFDGQTGWVAYFVVTVTGDTTLLPIPIPESNELSVNTEIALIASEPLEVSANNVVTATAYRRANVRSAPTTTATVIAQLRPGDVVDVIARNSEEGDWLQVEFGGQLGWVAYFLISLEGDLTVVPIFDADINAIAAPSATLAANSIALQTRYNANFRLEPSLEANILSVIPFGTKLSADARTENGWVRVVYEDDTGWILLSLVSILDNGDVTGLALQN